MRTVCAKCGLEYRCKKIGVPVVEMFLEIPRPYAIQYGDIYECPNCGHEIVTGVSRKRFHYEDNFDEMLKELDHPIVLWEKASDSRKAALLKEAE